jgi:ABC-type multidrug transport system permease subunit
MEEREKHPLEPLLEGAEDYGKTVFELLKLKTLDKTSTLASEIVINTSVIIIISMFFLVGTIGVSLWLGEILGKSWYGFFAVAGFYGIAGVVLYFFMNKWLKKVIGNFIIKHVLK